ncbi:hypothetical protein DFH06DRAFT_1140291 [Mycena polygramma]|nr:hypothetical protein DFH06DRAFT_1140291 [Mycena polygramma]
MFSTGNSTAAEAIPGVGAAAQQMFSTGNSTAAEAISGVGTAAQQMVSTSNSTAAEAILAHGPKIQPKLGLPASQHPVRARLQSAIWIFEINSGSGVGAAAQQMFSTGNSTAAEAISGVGTAAQQMFSTSNSAAAEAISIPLLLRPSVRTDPKSKPNWAYQQANTQFEPDCSLQFGFLKSTAGVGAAAQQMFSTSNSTAAEAIPGVGAAAQQMFSTGNSTAAEAISGVGTAAQQMVSTSNSTAAEAILAHGPKIQPKLGLPASQHPVRARLQSAIWIFEINSGSGVGAAAQQMFSTGNSTAAEAISGVGTAAQQMFSTSNSAAAEAISIPLLLRPSVRTDPKSKPNWAYQQANTQFEPDCSLQFGFLKSTAGVGAAAQQMFSTSNSTAAEAIRAHGPKIQTKLGLSPNSSQIAARKLDI